jgi:oxygen-independent coproporphyrinogen-3 oxidase
MCSYCAYPKVLLHDKFVRPYLEALKQELVSLNIKPSTIKSIYLGGGTPNALSDDDLKTLLMMLKPYYHYGVEYTIEMNPELVTTSQLELLQRFHINRLSIGVQTFNEKYLQEIKRHHNYRLVKTVIKTARDHHFNNISLDLMYGFKNQSEAELLEDLAKLISLKVEHVSLYPLMIEPGTVFGINKYPEMDETTFYRYYHLVRKTLKQAGFHHYEVVNFAKDSRFYSRHNLTYWTLQPYYGVGLGAASYVKEKRSNNTHNLTKYLKGDFKEYETLETKKEAMENYVIFGLRLRKGISIKAFEAFFSVSFNDICGTIAEKLIEQKLLYRRGQYLRVPVKQLLLLDYIGREFILDD